MDSYDISPNIVGHQLFQLLNEPIHCSDFSQALSTAPPDATYSG